MTWHRVTSFVVALALAGCAVADEEAAPQDADPVIAQLKASADADTTDWQAQVRLAAELRRKGRSEEAAQAAEKAFMLAPAPGTEARLEMAKVYAAADRSASAINLVKEVEKKKREGEPADEVKIAEVYAVLGDPNSVFRWLTRAVEANSPNLATLRSNPDFTSVHDDPRWQEITAKLP
jgi:lipopolysaccharide biosynthesis regulator YciM